MLDVNEIKWMSNIMDFGICVANKTTYLWNVFTIKLGFVNEMISICLKWIVLVLSSRIEMKW